MENVKHDYKYVEEHLNEYGEEYTEVKDKLRILQKQHPNMFEKYTDEMIQIVVYHGLHEMLIEKEKELIPENCHSCPFYKIEYEYRMFYFCEANEYYDSSFLLWGPGNKRPEWCKFNNMGL